MIMKKLVIAVVVLFALLFITEIHRINFINACNSKGELAYASVKLYFFNECGYNDLDTGRYHKL